MGIFSCDSFHGLDILGISYDLSCVKQAGGIDMTYLTELVSTALKSGPQAYLGVSLIFIYFAVIFSTAIYRIKQASKEGH
jgi:hypothetical protein